MSQPEEIPDPTLTHIYKDVEQLKKVVARLQQDLSKNTHVTQQIATQTQEIVEAFGAAKGAFKVLEVLGRIAKPLGAIVALIVGIAASWTSFKNIIITFFK